MQQNVYIAGDISYVSGTVNGASYVWTLTGDHVWSASNVTTADDGVYVIALTAIDTAGNELNVTTTVYEGLHLKTNWTDQDYYNATDLNRVGAAVQYLTDKLAANGYLVETAPKLDWTILDIPSVSQMEQYLGDVQRIRDGFRGTQNLPGNMDDLDGAGANSIEKALEEVETLLNRMIAATVAQCGICHCGGYV